MLGNWTDGQNGKPYIIQKPVEVIPWEFPSQEQYMDNLLPEMAEFSSTRVLSSWCCLWATGNLGVVSPTLQLALAVAWAGRFLKLCIDVSSRSGEVIFMSHALYLSLDEKTVKKQLSGDFRLTIRRAAGSGNNMHLIHPHAGSKAPIGLVLFSLADKSESRALTVNLLKAGSKHPL